MAKEEMYQDVTDGVAISTGRLSGLGRATAKRYIADGSKVAIFNLIEEEGVRL